MARTATAQASDKSKKKKKKNDPTAGTKGKAAKGQAEKPPKPPKPSKPPKPPKPPKPGKTQRKSEGLDGLTKFVDHPLIADLLAAGAIAAVAAIAEHQLGKGKGQGSSKMVKSVGKAAAAAMGRRLMGDIGAITIAAANAARKA